MIPAVLLLAPGLGVDNLVAGSAIGLCDRGVRARVRAGGILCFFAVGMPLAGLLLGHNLAASVGQVGRYVSGALLIGAGAHAIWATRRRGDPGHVQVPYTIGRLLSAGFGVNIDSLAVGFALGVFTIPLFTASAVIGAVTSAMSVAGLEIGARLGTQVEERKSRHFGGIVLAGIGFVLTARGLGF